MVTNLKIPDVALNTMLAELVASTWGFGIGQANIHLYKSNYTPVAGSTTSDFLSIEADFGGYAYVIVDTADWTPTVLVGDSAFIQGPPCAYIASGAPLPQTIYGYFVTDGSNAKIMWAQLFDTPVVLTNPGDFVLFSPTFTFQSEF